MVKLRLGVVLIATLLLLSCSKQEPAKTAEQQKAEMDKAAKTTRDNPVWGEQVKSMDKAKAVTEKAVQTAEEKLREGY
jgi:PBP1b-binding outer membrane lipoprotein LpoB